MGPIDKGGADLAITYTSQDATEVASSLAKDFGVKVQAFKCDVADSKQVDTAIEQVEAAFGKKIDIGVCNAGA